MKPIDNRHNLLKAILQAVKEKSYHKAKKLFYAYRNECDMAQNTNLSDDLYHIECYQFALTRYQRQLHHQEKHKNFYIDQQICFCWLYLDNYEPAFHYVNDMVRHYGQEKCAYVIAFSYYRVRKFPQSHGIAKRFPHQFKDAKGLFLTAMMAMRDKDPYEAINIFEQAQKQGILDNDGLLNLGYAYLSTNQLRPAQQCYDILHDKNPDDKTVLFNMSMVSLLSDDYHNGFAYYRYRRFTQTHAWRHYEKYGFQEWLRVNGKPQDVGDKKIIIIAEQGQGDSIQMLRFACMAQEYCSEVLLDSRDLLLRLSQEYVAEHEKITLCPSPINDRSLHHQGHYYILNMDLPYIFDIDVNDIPYQHGYINANKALIDDWRAKLGEKYVNLRIAMAWRGSDNPNVMHPLRYNDDDMLSLIKKLNDRASVELVNIIPEPISDAVHAQYGDQILDFHDQLTDFADTAAIMSLCDLVISVDTASCHLAGALNIPCWVTLPFSPDWRWGLGRTRATWYGSLRLFRATNHQKDFHQPLHDLAHVIPQLRPRIEQIIKAQPSEIVKKRMLSREEMTQAEWVTFLNDKINGLYQHHGHSAAPQLEYYSRILLQEGAEHILAYIMLLQSLHIQGKHDEAQILLNQYHHTYHEHAKKHSLVSVLDIAYFFHQFGRNDEALAIIDDILTHLTAKDTAELANAYAMKARIYAHNEDYNNAYSFIQQALSLDTDNIDYLRMQSIYETKINQPLKSLDTMRRLIELTPDDHRNHYAMASMFLSQGFYKEGFKLYESRLHNKEFAAVSHLPAHLPIWQGQKIKHLLICYEQGFGDTMQFIRYIKTLDGLVDHISIFIQSALYRLFSSSKNQWLRSLKKANKNITIDLILKIDNNFQADACVSLLSLAAISQEFGKKISHTPYLYPSKKAMQGLVMPPSFQQKFKIAVVWAGGGMYGNDMARTIPINDFAQILNLPDIAFFSLQCGSRQIELQHPSITNSNNIQDMSHWLNDFETTAVIMKNMDLVISVDTSTAHLAGALNVPCWLLLSHHISWRWPHKSEKTLWYPKMRILRFNQDDNWQRFIARMVDRLKEEVG